MPNTNVSGEEWQQMAMTLAGCRLELFPKDYPKFRGLHHNHPVAFFKRLEYCLRSYDETAIEKLEIAKNSLKGRTEQWKETREATWCSYNNFWKDFLAFYWSAEHQKPSGFVWVAGPIIMMKWRWLHLSFDRWLAISFSHPFSQIRLSSQKLCPSFQSTYSGCGQDGPIIHMLEQ